MADGYQYSHGDTPLEGFVIQRAVGRGGFGEVYYAISDAGREVALKVIHGYEQIEIRGVSQCMNLKSPHLVSIFDIKKNAEGKTFVVMEYVNGPSLKDLLEQSPAGMGPAKTAFFLRELAKGLSYLHERGIVHRDLKPGNIFYEDGYVKIGDYGLSKAIGVSRHSGQTLTVGTVQYMAPEIGMGKYDRSIDIYAMGIVIYEMLTGQVPFLGSSHGEILMKHLMAQPDLTGIEEPFATVIRKSMSKDPADRYQSVQEMVEAVFGAEHVRNSVSCFSPDSLTMVAGRVAQKAAVGAGGGTGSSGANDGGYGTYKPPITDDSSDVWGRVAQQVDEKTSRLRERMQERGDRIRLRYQVRTGGAQAAADLPGDVDPRRDPLNSRQRRTLAVMTSVAVSFGIVWLNNGELGLGLMSLAIIAILSPTLLLADRFAGPRLAQESRWTRRFVYGGSAALAMLVAIPVSTIMLRIWALHGLWNNHEPIWAFLFSILISLFFVDWSSRISAERKDRISLGSAFMAGLTVWILGQIFFSHSSMRHQFDPNAAGILAGISLAVQALAAFDPIASRRCKLLGDAVDKKSTHEPAGQTAEPAFASPGTTARAGQFSPQTAQADRATYPQGRPQQRPLLVVPGWMRTILIGLFVMAFGSSILMLVAAGVGNFRSEEFGFMVGAGIGSMLFSFFCLARAIRRTYRTKWSGFFRPALTCLCLITAFISLMVMANSNHLNDDELIIGLAFIIFPVLFAIVIRFFSDPLVDSTVNLFVSRQQVARGDSAVSDKDAFVALLLACAGFFGFGGLHRFYAGKWLTGLVWLLTLGGFMIGTIVDVVTICMGIFKDGQYRPLQVWMGVGRSRPMTNNPGPVYEWPAVGSNPAAQMGQAAAQLGKAAAQVAEVPSRIAQNVFASAFAGANKPWWIRQRSVYAPCLTNRWLSMLGVMMGIISVSIAILIATNTPMLIMAGFPDPSLARDLSRLFGYSDWPRLLTRVGEMAAIGTGLAAAITILLARRRCGAAHVARVIFATIGCFLAMTALRSACQGINWVTTVPLMQDGHAGPALENLMDQLQTNQLFFAGLLLLVSVVILAWPEPRERLDARAAEVEAS